MKRHEAESVGDIIRQAFERAGAAETFDRQRVSYLWPEIVGPSINRETTRRWVDGDTLHVCIASASLRNDLGYMAPSLVEKLNAAAGKPVIRRILFH
ncbi:MAG: DUF721 domain-containing protein [Muribaculaceae bacterium]|nr:DUF721 domain-containing protein [Muribaculaceae bacterium]